MAITSCAKCGTHFFEVKQVEPHGSDYKINFVQCSKCGTVVGVMDVENIGEVLKMQNDALKKIGRALKISVGW